MTMTLKPATPTDRERIIDAVELLRNARTMLRLAGATKATEAAQKAVNSAEGALRHVDRRLTGRAEACPTSGCGPSTTTAAPPCSISKRASTR